LRRPFVIFDVVKRADDRMVDDPEIGLPELLIERQRRAGGLLGNGDRPAI
jgi:hypothetical protein